MKAALRYRAHCSTVLCIPEVHRHVARWAATPIPGLRIVTGGGSCTVRTAHIPLRRDTSSFSEGRRFKTNAHTRSSSRCTVVHMPR